MDNCKFYVYFQFLSSLLDNAIAKNVIMNKRTEIIEVIQSDMIYFSDIYLY